MLFLAKAAAAPLIWCGQQAVPYRDGLFVLKGLHKAADPARLKRFLRERNFLKTLDHPNLLQLIDEGTYYERPFIVQPYAPKTLRQELGGKALSFGKALAFACQLLSGLQALHQQNVLHRDVKPENIFVNGATVQLGDFGLMKQLGGAADEVDREDFHGYCAGAFYYRTPELVTYANGTSALDLRSDIFQLGLVIAEMFSGRNPLAKAESFADAIVLNPVAPINGKYAGLVANTINEMLKENPDKRISLDKALDGFNGAFENYAKAYYELHEQFFLN